MTTAILLDQLRARLAKVQQRIAACEVVEFGSADLQAATGALAELRNEQLWLASLIDDIETMSITCEVVNNAGLASVGTGDSASDSQ